MSLYHKRYLHGFPLHHFFWHAQNLMDISFTKLCIVTFTVNTPSMFLLCISLSIKLCHYIYWMFHFHNRLSHKSTIHNQSLCCYDYTVIYFIISSSWTFIIGPSNIYYFIYRDWYTCLFVAKSCCHPISLSQSWFNLSTLIAPKWLLYELELNILHPVRICQAQVVSPSSILWSAKVRTVRHLWQLLLKD